MNLVQEQQYGSVISYFRAFQYAKLDYLIDLGMQYLINLGLNVDPNVYSGEQSIEKVYDSVYSRIYHFACTIYKIQIKKTVPTNYFMYVSIPNLLNEMFFKLNSTYYIPILYIVDEPIVVKENSVTVQSLFQPITFYFTESRVIFMGNNYNLSDFLNLLTYNWDASLRNHTQKLFNIQFNPNINPIVSLVASKLNCLADHNIIINLINTLFFDPYTAALYKQFYDVNTFDEILLKVLQKRYDRQVNGIKYKFNDLRYKRLVFIEMILKPFFKAISMFSGIILNKNQQTFNLKLKINEIVENFYMNLHGQCLYDTVNGFSGILAHKATFKNPYGSGELPKEVSSIHWTHKGRICPNSISNHDAGQDVFLVPNQDIDLEYGIFKFTPEEMERPS